MEAGLDRFTEPEERDGFLARVAFASEHGPVPILDSTHLQHALTALCTGLRSFAELEAAARNGGLVRALELELAPRERRLLEELAPSRIQLQRGRQAKVNYARGKPPWLASRLQDFFGMRETPRIAGGKVPVVLHLLAPNQRPVQMTTDLSGFWQRLYPQVRRELCRRYPKHAWPEDPLRVSGSEMRR
jgi:ATP-dependent helicase HrpB